MALFAAGKAVSFIAPPVDFSLKFFELHRAGFVVVLHACRVRMFVEPDVFGRLAFGEEQNIGFDAGVRAKHAVRQTHDGVQVALFGQHLFDFGFYAFTK